jgi:hypothetical protein
MGLGLEYKYNKKSKLLYTFEDCVCVCMLLLPVGRRVEEFETPAELLFRGICDCVAGKCMSQSQYFCLPSFHLHIAHKVMLSCPGQFLHWDISLNNILLPFTLVANVGDQGFLIDFDYAKLLPCISPHNQRGQPLLGPALSLKDSMLSINSLNVPKQPHHNCTVCCFVSILNDEYSMHFVGHETLDGHQYFGAVQAAQLQA